MFALFTHRSALIPFLARFAYYYSPVLLSMWAEAPGQHKGLRRRKSHGFGAGMCHTATENMTVGNLKSPVVPWWGSLDVPLDQTVHGQIGPLQLWIQRRSGLWRVSTLAGSNPLEGTATPLFPVADSSVDLAAEAIQVVSQGKGVAIRVNPAPADRPLVTRPDAPFVVPSGGEAVLFVGAPLWVQIRSIDSEVSLLDRPIYRPSDTWFGPTTDLGELCYSSKTSCRMRIEDVVIRPHRSVTAVTLRNDTREELCLDRLQIPVQALALYLAADGRLWTQDVLMVRNEVGEHADVSARKSAPAFALDPVQVVAARTEGPNHLVRAFRTLFA